MSIDDLKERLYDEDSGLSDEEKDEREDDYYYNPEKASGTIDNADEDWKKVRRGLSNQQKKLIKIALIIIGAMVLIFGIVFAVLKYKAGSFEESRVKIEIQGPKDVDSGELVEYKILIDNANRAKLQDAELTFNYSGNFKPEGNNKFEYQGDSSSRINLGKIDSRSKNKEVILRGRFTAPKNSVVYIKSTLSYIPSNFNSRFKINEQIGIKVKTNPVELNISAPKEILSGNDVQYLVEYENSNSFALDNLVLMAEYSDDFQFKNAKPYPLKKNNHWYLGTLKSDESGKIIIDGNIKGEKGSANLITFKLGTLQNNGSLVVYNQQDFLTKIASTPLELIQTVNEKKEININPGEELMYQIDYRNKGEIGLRGLVISLKLDSPILDFSEIGFKGHQGYYDQKNNSIIWKAAEIKELANLEPGQGGSIFFTIPVKDRIEINNEMDKNFEINSVVTASSSDLDFYSLGSSKILSNNTNVKLNSKVIADVKIYYNDSNIDNLGPIPPKVGEETTYTIHWLITNVSNDLTETTVKAILPTGVKWKNKIYPESENIDFNSKTNEITWTAGDVSSGKGILTPPREVSFQVGITPSINQVGHIMKLLGKTYLNGKDKFTGASVEKILNLKTTEIKEDVGVGNDGFKVSR